MLDANNRFTTYSYDEQNRLSRIENAFGEITTITYDPLGREAHRYLSNGMEVGRTYDEIGRAHTLSCRAADGSMVALYTLTYDSVGSKLRQRLEELDGSVVTFLYDETYQLVQEHRTGTAPFLTTHEYDGVGNRLLEVTATPNGHVTTTTYSYDAANRLTGQGSVSSVTLLPNWQPSNVAALDLWLRADAGVTLNSFGGVGAWADQSGQGNNATQATDSQSPLLVEGALNGKAVLQFDGSNDFLSTSYTGPQNDEVTLFVVARAESLAHYKGLLCFGTTGGSDYLAYPRLDADKVVFASSNDGGTADGVATGLVANEWNIGCASWHRHAPNGAQTYRNGTLVAQRPSNDSALPQEPLLIGQDENLGGSAFTSAEVAEVLIYSRALSPLERDQISTYLSQKYDISLA
jgi:YD repeat-containing protein